MSEDLEDFGATKHELIEAIHAGANVKDIARLEAAIWRLFDRAHALHYFMRVRNELQQKTTICVRRCNRLPKPENCLASGVCFLIRLYICLRLVTHIRLLATIYAAPAPH